VDDEAIDAFLKAYRLPIAAGDELRRLSDAPSSTQDDDRYDERGLLGRGGMAEVVRVHDARLGRKVARKTLHARLAGHPRAVERFLGEARATAQLTHPNIIPIHDLGTDEEGRVWFTMPEIRGQTLGEVIAAVHTASTVEWRTTRDGWSLRRLVSSFLTVCNAVSYAHQRGVVHRDLKPDNVMVGRMGETWVVDWGLAKILGRAATPTDEEEEELTLVIVPDAKATRQGRVAGTPAYMAPEQARGDVAAIDARTDVYALGAILYELLSGERPYGPVPAADALAALLEGPPPAVDASTPVDEEATERLGPVIPPALAELCAAAMARDPADRPASAVVLAETLEAWLDGARQADDAAALVTRALAGEQEVEHLRAEAAALRLRGENLLEPLAPWDHEDAKSAGWSLLDQAEALQREAARRDADVDVDLHAALQLVGDLTSAHEALARRIRIRHEVAEAAGHTEEAERAERALRGHVAALPPHNVHRVRSLAYLRGQGSLTLVAEPSGATARIYRYTLHRRRLVPAAPIDVELPLHRHVLPMGSYLAVIQHAKHRGVRYPFQITRQGHWAHDPVRLPPAGLLTRDERYIPAGPCIVGGDPVEQRTAEQHRVWVPSFVIARFPVTNAQYIAFLDDLVAQGVPELAARYVPREAGSQSWEQAPAVYAFDGRRYTLQADTDGDVWAADEPVIQIDWHAARGYCRWLADRTGRPWRLPSEVEWEKAGRGVDGRTYPWGDAFDPSWCQMTESVAKVERPSPVDAFPIDESPYGVRGMAGNVSDWCMEREDEELPADGRLVIPDEPLDVHPDALGRVLKGGWFYAERHRVALAHRRRFVAGHRWSSVGFRPAYTPDW
jgi:serine/threonine-protein kinase